MMRHRLLPISAVSVLLSASFCLGEIKVDVARNEGDLATPAFKFKNVPSPAKTNAATKAKFTIVDGQRDQAGAEIDVLNDGKLPGEADEPGSNFFFGQNEKGGRIGVDLGGAIEIKQVNTYSWHPDTRGPQIYKLYASDGSASNFDVKPKKGTDPTKAGWKYIAAVDTSGNGGGQFGVSIHDTDGVIGKYRYLLFDISQTEGDDPFGNTFYSEINVINNNGSATGDAVQEKIPPLVFHSANPDCEITIDTSAAPELKEWVQTKLGPTLAEWYPKIVAALPSDGYTPPKSFTVLLRPGNGVAATSRTRVTANSGWLKRELNREAVGALLHEEVHVVQQYGRVPRELGWLVEGIPDYIRWYKFEPQSHGADIPVRRADTARYNGAYRPSANFLNYVTEKYDKDIVKKLDAALRQHKFDSMNDLWKQSTGKTVEELATEWKQYLKDGSKPLSGT